jgi:predicted DNA-binding transcriptional regulator YafY
MIAPASKRRIDHDTLVYRLTEILVKLNRGEKLDPRSLATEFNVDLRTIQRDLNQRFAYLELTRLNGKYQLNPTVIGKLSTADIERFAIASGTRGLFPTLSHAFVRQLLTEGEDSSFLVRGPSYEDISAHADMFELLRDAIADRSRVRFEFAALVSGAAKTFSMVEPYRLLNHKGVW